MGKSEIVRVWGKADQYDLSFRMGADGSWNTVIPPDLTDGQYAAEIHAQDASGRIAIWSGILYMHNGHACLHLKQRKHMLWFMPRAEIIPKYQWGAKRHRIEFKGVRCR